MILSEIWEIIVNMNARRSRVIFVIQDNFSVTEAKSSLFRFFYAIHLLWGLDPGTTTQIHE
jgi:hypothetical protein